MFGFTYIYRTCDNRYHKMGVRWFNTKEDMLEHADYVNSLWAKDSTVEDYEPIYVISYTREEIEKYF